MKSGKSDLETKAFLGREDGKIMIKVWMNFPKNEQEYFLTIDEVFDSKKQKKSALVHPYLIVLKTHEPILTYPLDFEKLINPNCKNNSGEIGISRRNTSLMKSSRNVEDSNINWNEFKEIFMDIKKQEGEIKKKLLEYAQQEESKKKEEELHETLIVDLKDEREKQEQNFQKQIKNQKYPAEDFENSEQVLENQDQGYHFNVPEEEPLSSEQFDDHQFKTHQDFNKNPETWDEDSQDQEIEQYEPEISRENYRRHMTAPNWKHRRLNHDNPYQVQSSQERFGSRSSARYPNFDSRQNDYTQNAYHHDGSRKYWTSSNRMDSKLPNFNRNHEDWPDERRIFEEQEQKFRTKGRADVGLRNHGRFGENLADEHFDYDPPEDEQDYPDDYSQNSPQFSDKWPEVMRKHSPANNYQKSLSSRRNRAVDMKQICSDRHLKTSDKLKFINSLTTNEKLDENLHQAEKIFDPSVVVVQHEKQRRMKREVGGSRGSLNDDLEKPGIDKDKSYLVYKINQPFHHLQATLQIFRKDSSTWKRVLPEITLTSLSKKYVNDSLIISFASRSNTMISSNETFEFKNARLLVHKHAKVLNPAESLVALVEDQSPEPDISELFCESSEKESLVALKSIRKFPNNQSVLEKCQDGEHEFCLNLVDEEVNPFKLAIQMPFTENAVIDEVNSTIRIWKIFSDAGFGSNLQLHFSFLSTSHFPSTYNLMLDGCLLLSSLNVSHQFELPPNTAKSVDINVTVPLYLEHHKQKCQAKLIDGEQKVQAKREFLVKPDMRCVCLWFCSCFCFDMFISTEAHNLCPEMNSKNLYFDGFENKKQAIWDWKQEVVGDYKIWLIIGSIAIVLLLLLLGCIKGCLGCCFKDLGSWKYNYLQPNLPYQEAGRCRRFFVNLLFFLVTPFIWCCNCFSPAKGNGDCGPTYWNRSAKCQEIHEDSDVEDEKSSLLRDSHRSLNHDRYSETVFDIQNHGDDRSISDTEFVVAAVNNSHLNLSRIASHYSEENLNPDPRFQEAKKLVESLLAAKVVYRKFNKVIGNVQLKDDQPYSIRGYFLPSYNTGYQFMTSADLVQYWEVSNEGSLIMIDPTIKLESRDFRKVYANKLEVLEADELSIFPILAAPCVNVRVQTPSMYKMLETGSGSSS